MEDDLQHIKVHFIIPLIMRLIETLMIQLRFVWYYQGSEMKIIIVKVVIYKIFVKIQFAGADLCPFKFHCWGYIVPGFDLLDALINFLQLALRASDRSENHYIYSVVFKTTCFITIHIIKYTLPQLYLKLSMQFQFSTLECIHI